MVIQKSTGSPWLSLELSQWVSSFTVWLHLVFGFFKTTMVSANVSLRLQAGTTATSGWQSVTDFKVKAVPFEMCSQQCCDVTLKANAPCFWFALHFSGFAWLTTAQLIVSKCLIHLSMSDQSGHQEVFGVSDFTWWQRTTSRNPLSNSERILIFQMVVDWLFHTTINHVYVEGLTPSTYLQWTVQSITYCKLSALTVYVWVRAWYIHSWIPTATQHLILPKSAGKEYTEKFHISVLSDCWSIKSAKCLTVQWGTGA